MQDQTVLVAGGAGGLGRATVRMLLARGARVAVIDRCDDLLQALSDDLGRDGHAITGIAGDITTRAEAERLLDAAVAALGSVRAMVNCVGVYPRVPILAISDANWQDSCTVNIVGTYNLMAAAVPHMRGLKAEADVRGRIINISSVDAFKAHPQNAHYAATKAAVVSLTRSFAMEFASEKILINSVAPAGIATERAKASGFMPELVAANPLGRAAEPDDIAEVIVFLASRANRYVTGENVIVSGGYIMA